MRSRAKRSSACQVSSSSCTRLPGISVRPCVRGDRAGTRPAARAGFRRARSCGRAERRARTVAAAIPAEARSTDRLRLRPGPVRTAPDCRSRPSSPPWMHAKCETPPRVRSEEHTSELQSRGHLVCRLLLEKKKKNIKMNYYIKKKKKKKKKK